MSSLLISNQQSNLINYNIALDKTTGATDDKRKSDNVTSANYNDIVNFSEEAGNLLVQSEEKRDTNIQDDATDKPIFNAGDTNESSEKTNTAVLKRRDEEGGDSFLVTDADVEDVFLQPADVDEDKEADETAETLSESPQATDTSEAGDAGGTSDTSSLNSDDSTEINGSRKISTGTVNYEENRLKELYEKLEDAQDVLNDAQLVLSKATAELKKAENNEVKTVAAQAKVDSAQSQVKEAQSEVRKINQEIQRILRGNR